MTNAIIPILFLCFFGISEQKQYSKDYYSNGKLKSQGWLNQNEKVDYWFYYYENGLKKEEGHYLGNKKTKWWIFYNSNEEIIRKSEYKDNKQNGLSILYKSGKICKAEKYKMGIKIKEWHNLMDYQKDNKE
ncbi:toxin-antitoxin system YwqK family antitoxin [Flavobacterium faecale]|uniref:toxin-antitoxin system YwqK family antitoxin n=1 Tax=Flavobacterium faecale TaxID=1355330 RepID=UPI003AAA8D00